MQWNQHSEWDARIGRRLRACELRAQGWKQKDIAAELGVSPTAVSQWLKRARTEGEEQLRRPRAHGATPRLAVEQRRELRRLLEYGPEAFGFEEAVWTSKRVAAVIRRWFGVSYHRAHVSKLLRSLGLYVAVPAVWSSRRDNAVIEAWWDLSLAELRARLEGADHDA